MVFCFGTLEMAIVILDHGFRKKFEYIWLKTQPIVNYPNTKSPMTMHETIYVFIKKELKTMDDLFMDKQSLRTIGTPYKTNTVTHPASEFRISQLTQTSRSITNNGYREGTTILKYPNKPLMRKTERTAHPTQKPLELCQLLCRAYCKSSGVILDPFMGSGTSCLAAKTSNRKYIGVEIEPKYYDMAKTRLDSTL